MTTPAPVKAKSRAEMVAEVERLEREAEEARMERAKRSFVRFLEDYVRIESDSPDPRNRGAIAFKLHPYQRERAEAWQNGDDEVILKARQLGFTWLAAAYALWVAAYHESSHVAIFSAGVREVRKVLRRIRYIHRQLPKELQADGNLAVDSISFPNDSVITGFPSTEHAGIGETNRLVIFDEWAMHPYGEANLAAVLPTTAAGGQIIGMSTANPELGPTGHFYEQWEAAVDGSSGAEAIFVPWFARPERTPEWLAKQRARHKGTDASFSAYYPGTAEDAFKGRQGLVYPEFDLERHIRIMPPVPWEETLERRFATDYGGGDPSAVVVGGTYRRTNESYSRIHIYGLGYWTSGAPTVEQIVQFLGPWSKQGWTQGEGDPAPGGEVINQSLRGEGFPCRRGYAVRGEGLGLVSQYLQRGWLTFDPECKDLFREFASYRWKPQTDPNSRERYATKTPQDHHGDALDALRLLVVGHFRDEHGNADAFSEVFTEVRL